MTTKLISLRDYMTGENLGKAEVTETEYYQIEARAQQPHGIFRADSLSPENLARLDLRANQTVFFADTWA